MKPGITIIAATVLMTAVFSFAQPLFSRYRTGAEFWRKSSEILSKSDIDHLVYYGERPDMDALYYLNFSEPIKIVNSREELAGFMAKHINSNVMLIVEDSQAGMPEIGNAKLVLQENLPLNLTGKDKQKIIRHGMWLIKAR